MLVTLLINKLKLFKIGAGKLCKIGVKTGINNSVLEGANKIGSYTSFNNAVIGYASYIGNDSILDNCIVGKYSSIASDVKIITGSHPTTRWVTTHPAFYSKGNQSGVNYCGRELFQEIKYAKSDKYVEIGNDVWVGYGVRIMQGVRINNGAIVGAGALVTKDVPAYAIVAGIPAKVIRYRFSEDEIRFLSKLQWWNKDPDWISEHLEYFSDIDKMKGLIEY